MRAQGRGKQMRKTTTVGMDVLCIRYRQPWFSFVPAKEILGKPHGVCPGDSRFIVVNVGDETEEQSTLILKREREDMMILSR